MPEQSRGITPCIPGKSTRKVPIPYACVLKSQRHRIENMFGKLKDWRRNHTRYDRCAPHLHVRNMHRGHRHLLALTYEA